MAYGAIGRENIYARFCSFLIKPFYEHNGLLRVPIKETVAL